MWWQIQLILPCTDQKIAVTPFGARSGSATGPLVHFGKQTRVSFRKRRRLPAC